MSFLKKSGVVLGTIVALIVLFVLGIIGYILYQFIGIIFTGAVLAGLVWYIFFYEDKTKKPLP